MRVLFLSTLEAVPWGGSEELWHLLAERLLEQGHIIGINRIEWTPVPVKLQQLINGGAEIFYRPNIHIPRPISDIGFRIKNKLYNLRGWKDINTFQPDFIVISQGGIFDDYIPKITDTILTFGVPYIIISQYANEFGYLEEVKRRVFKRLFLQAQKIFFVSHRNQTVAERILTTRLPNAEVVYNPIKIERNVSLPYPADLTVKWACIARLEVMYKGQDVLLQTLSSLKWKERNWKLSLFGQGPQKNYLEDLIQFYDLSAKVELKGHVQDVAEIWQSHQLLILPSHSEGTPLALLEAAYCSRAAVVTDVGGNTEIITEGVSGFVAETASVNALDKALERAWQGQNQWEAMGKNARTSVIDVVGYNNFDSILKTIVAHRYTNINGRVPEK